MELAAGRLLIASPLLGDPNFARSIVLLLNADDDGALGVILNRPSGTRVDEVLGPWAGLVRTPEVLFQGGPVETNAALALARVADAEEDLVGWRPLFDSTGLVDLDTPVELLEGGLAELRIYAGYAGWSAGQLEAEIESGAWLVVPAEASDLFAADPDQLWGQVLRRQPGEVRLLATMPADPTMN
ncbi:MAG TPA: YqgE/AlgH family protein [Marmoricola sp.]|nr:YqgE/AlgH family protein [Marmoricola sp.]